MRQFELPTLYKKGSTGKIVQWTIGVEEIEDTNERLGGVFPPTWGVIRTEHGQVGGKLQTTEDTVKKGKNTGRANQTTPYDQACAEAQSKWQVKVDEGYVEDAGRAEAGETDTDGGIFPMLANVYANRADKVTFPVAVQRKFDGVRCIAQVKRGQNVTLWSRKRKPITSVPHIAKAIAESVPSNFEGFFDGELYNHAYRDNFNEIVSLVRQAVPKPGHEVVEYHVYDLFVPSFSSLTYANRHDEIRNLLVREHPIVLVDSFGASDEEELFALYDSFRAEGYEGAMVRAWGSIYAPGKRCDHLLKVKSFFDIDAEIYGIEEGRGKLAGKVGKFLCRLPNGVEFKATPAVPETVKAAYFEDHSLWQGKTLVVKIQNYTPAGVPRIPIGLRFREEVEG